MYHVVLQTPAKLFLKKLDKHLSRRITLRLRELREDPELGKPLVGRLAGLWSLRVGQFRVLYEIRHGELVVVVIDVAHRKKAYRK
jgi:mRNA interferase RelE/StbE